MSAPVFDRELISRCQTNAPRYTSYPTADRFNVEFTKTSQLSLVQQVFNPEFKEPISLYIHIPFCNTLCLFCACNKIITNKRESITKYLIYLEREVELYFKLNGNRKLDVVQLHFGGGSPSWLSVDEINQVMEMLRKYFNLNNAKEIAMELDPRHVKFEFMQALRNNGFNRVSLGVQDFDLRVQKAVNRVQSYEATKNVLDWANELNFSSTNVDLIYGLPFQNVETFCKTIDTIVALRPARIALFNYAHLPHMIKAQTRINEADLPSNSEKLDILTMCVDKLSAAGYVFIGMDHFALPDEELAISLNNGMLHRNFQGYSTFSDVHMLSFGISAIGFIGNSYYQNIKELDGYYQALDKDELPILRGILLNKDDIIRRYVIQQIMCQFELDFEQISKKFDFDFCSYFADELEHLAELIELGLCELVLNSKLQVTARGRYLIRNVAKVFDKYLNKSGNNKRYSKVI